MREKYPYQVYDAIYVNGILDFRLPQYIFCLLILAKNYVLQLTAALF